MRRPVTKLLEVMGVTLLMTIVSFIMPMIWGTCTPKPVDMEDWTAQVKELLLFAFNQEQGAIMLPRRACAREGRTG